MITLLTGENSFEIAREIKRIAAAFEGSAERVDGSELELKQLPDLLMGATLFADKRLVIVKNLSENKPLWGSLEEWLPRLSSDIHLVLVEPKPDKRTKTYKALQKLAAIHEYRLWTDKDISKAEQWATAEARQLGFVLDKKSAHTLIARVGLDQWVVYQALQKLAVVDSVSPRVVENLTEAYPAENVFQLFETALKGDTIKLQKMLATIEVSEDPYRLFGLLSGQAIQLAALVVANQPTNEVAKDLGAHPFVLAKLAPYAKTHDKTAARRIVAAFAEADGAMKTSGGEPWLLIERALLKIACL